MTNQVSPQEALIFVMVMASAVDNAMAETELVRIGQLIDILPVFDDFEKEDLLEVSQRCAKILAGPEGLDIALETIRDARFALGAMLERADPRDRLVVRGGVTATTIADLPHGARLGTSSPRRAAQVRRLRPDLVTMLLRGNVQTRLAKLAAGEVDATLLAAAGLDRLGMHDIGRVWVRLHREAQILADFQHRPVLAQDFAIDHADGGNGEHENIIFGRFGFFLCGHGASETLLKPFIRAKPVFGFDSYAFCTDLQANYLRTAKIAANALCL